MLRFSLKYLLTQKEAKCRKFPGGPVVGTLHFHCWGVGLIPDQGTEVSQAALCRVTCDQKETQIFSFFVLCISLMHTLWIASHKMLWKRKGCGENAEPIKLKSHSMDLQHLCFIENASTVGIITLINLIFFLFRWELRVRIKWAIS